VGAVSVYLDVNAIVPLFTVDALNDRAEKALRSLNDALIISDFSAAEFCSVIARRVRTRDLRTAEAQTAFFNFDSWCNRYTRRAEMESTDVSGAIRLLRRLDLALRTPDALHIAIVRRTGCKLLSFDIQLARAARALGIEILPTDK
jgi:predicted nucleic acid-binding protein